MKDLPKMLEDFKETVRLLGDTLEQNKTHPVKTRFVRTFERLLTETARLMDDEAVFSQYGLLRGFCETAVMYECLLDHEKEESLTHYENYIALVNDYFDSIDEGHIHAEHAENDRPHQYDWYNAMKRGGFTTSKVSLKTLASDANKPLLDVFHILNVKIHNAEFFTTMLEEPRFKAREIQRLNAVALLVIDHLVRIFTLHLKSETTKPLLDALDEKRNHMKQNSKHTIFQVNA